MLLTLLLKCHCWLYDPINRVCNLNLRCHVKLVDRKCGLENISWARFHNTTVKVFKSSTLRTTRN